ncbi:RIIB lysis inhibitor [Caulobacter phage CcrRogue]|uniref:Putative rIIb-like protein n=1 Tax=Caulobacter phage CcrRogue TaxID=2927986 RepID=K4K325_9CAUD|nr:RIIB lysis inhibitor [Caulobacter phage CcrRogue]AFU86617.1 putative rIIb-like protein [Caulobacter phage CcrRogue]
MTTQAKVAVTITVDAISITLDGRYRSFPRGSSQGKKLEEAVKKVPQDIDEIRLIADVAAYVAAHSFGRVILDDRDRLRLDGKVVDYVAAGTFKRVLAEGFDMEPLTNFIANVDQNPDKSIAADLYAFLEKGRNPLTPDGMFHAFKRVGEDYFDLHSHTVEYKIGSTVSMDRDLCDPNRNQTCSRGLHACSFDYLRSFHGGRGKIIIVEINPKDVTAIPTDYNLTKLRCCEMKVLGEIPEADAVNYFTAAVERRYAEEKAAQADAQAQVDPEIETDATAADGVITTEAPEAVVEAEATDWAKIGHDAGLKAGAADQDNGYEYDASFDLPGELTDGPDSARQAYSEGYVKGYGVGFSAAATDDASDEKVEETASTDETPAYDANGFAAVDHDLATTMAKSWGREDAEKLIAQAMSQTDEGVRLQALVDLVEGEGPEGERLDVVAESALDNSASADKGVGTYSYLYEEAFEEVLVHHYAAWAKLAGDRDGRLEGEYAETFDLDAEKGEHYSNFTDLEDENNDDVGPLYKEAYAKAYVAAFANK